MNGANQAITTRSWRTVFTASKLALTRLTCFGPAPRAKRLPLRTHKHKAPHGPYRQHAVRGEKMRARPQNAFAVQNVAAAATALDTKAARSSFAIASKTNIIHRASAVVTSTFSAVYAPALVGAGTPIADCSVRKWEANESATATDRQRSCGAKTRHTANKEAGVWG